MARQPMPISSRWFQGAMLTYLVGFTVLGMLAYLFIATSRPSPKESWPVTRSCLPATILSAE